MFSRWCDENAHLDLHNVVEALFCTKLYFEDLMLGLLSLALHSEGLTGPLWALILHVTTLKGFCSRNIKTDNFFIVHL